MTAYLVLATKQLHVNIFTGADGVRLFEDTMMLFTILRNV